MDSSHIPGYAVKRWAVVAFCGVNIFLMIIMMALSKVISDYIVDHAANINTLTPSEKSAVETTATVLIIVSCVFSILFQLFGLIGALKENVCLTITYLVLQILGALYGVIRCFGAPYYIPSAIWSVLTTILVFLFLRDLRTLRNGPRTATPYYA